MVAFRKIAGPMRYGGKDLLSSGGRKRSSATGNTLLRSLIMISRHVEISGAVAAAIEREFPRLTVTLLSDLRHACIRFDVEAQLILVEHRLIGEFATISAEIRRWHPTAHLAIMVDGDPYAVGKHLASVDMDTVCGVVPLNVNLDLLLSTLSILLKGGECFPASLLRAARPAPIRQPVVQDADGNSALAAPFEDASDLRAAMPDLTEREIEVLASVARGCRNKMIAADLSLSQHTVKLHIHNIITKLGVHNRTEAAVVYLERVRAAGAASVAYRGNGIAGGATP